MISLNSFNNCFFLNLCNWHLQQITDRNKHYCIYDTSYSSRIQSTQVTKPQICASNDFNENFTINNHEILQPVFKKGDEQLSCFIWLYILQTDFLVLNCQRLKLDKLSFCTCQCCSLSKFVVTDYSLRWSPTSKTWGKPIATEYKYWTNITMAGISNASHGHLIH